MDKTKKQRVIIVGGGFGGISAAKVLGNSEYEVILFDRTNYHLFQPLLYQVASAVLAASDIAVPIREVVSQYKNITVLMDRVDNIDGHNNQINTAAGNTYKYDYLILAVGAKHSYFANPEWEKFAPGLKTLDDAYNIRNSLLHIFEEAENKHMDPSEELNLVVVGGGPTGVEMAGALAEIAKETLVNDFRRIDSSKAHVYLLEGAPQILGMYPEALAKKAQGYLEKLGVTVLLNSIVTNITEDRVEIGDTVIKTQNIIWAAGNKACSLLAKIGTELDKVGRVVVNPDLSTKKFDNIFVIGDAAHFRTDKGNILPGLAPVAMQQGRHIGRTLVKNKRKNFFYFDKGSMATVGKYKAIMKKGPFEASGFFAWLSCAFVHIMFLIDFRTKIAVFTHWAYSLLFLKRGVRLIFKTHDDSK